MALKKSDLYSTLWASCDELRGGMDASQYKDYVLVMLFVKYVSDRFSADPFSDIVIPDPPKPDGEAEGGELTEAQQAIYDAECAKPIFTRFVELKGKKDIGDLINKEIIKPLFDVNNLPSPPDFNDNAKLGNGKEMIDRLTNLIGVFEKPELNFASNRAEGDDILGDAYEYLMRHFATESGKSKGQFYTPAEVSRIMAKIVGISEVETSSSTTVYDPTCGSGSLLLKVGDEAHTEVTLYGQEKDVATSSLARMNMILHNQATAEISNGNTLANPSFIHDDGSLKTFDFVVANPPFSDKRWTTGLTPDADPFKRFELGTPPDKQGDYAYLLHILRSLKSTGKGTCILPHGVLFRGGAEGAIRQNLLKRGFFKAIIGLPANLFYGTGIPACIILLDKEGAETREEVFMMDASKGFIKDGNKNRLRERDIHRIVDVFMRGAEEPRYSRRVSLKEIEENDYNLNIPRYIDAQEAEDVQDIAGHLLGGVPGADLDGLSAYWTVCPSLREVLFDEVREGYFGLRGDKSEVKATIFAHPEFVSFTDGLKARFAQWCTSTTADLRQLKKLGSGEGGQGDLFADPVAVEEDAGSHPKALIKTLGSGVLSAYADAALLDPYDVYQHLMDYWAEVMQDDMYLLRADGWVAEVKEIFGTAKRKGKEVQVSKGWYCDLIPKELIVRRYFSAEAEALSALEAELESASATQSELEEEHGGEEGLFAEFEKMNKADVKRRLKEIKGDVECQDEAEALKAWLTASESQTSTKKAIKEADAKLDALAKAKYATLSEEEVKRLVIEDKWMRVLSERVDAEVDRVSQALAQRLKVLVERYESPLSALEAQVATMQSRVRSHLERMGF